MLEAPDASSEALVRDELERIADELVEFAAFAAVPIERRNQQLLAMVREYQRAQPLPGCTAEEVDSGGAMFDRDDSPITLMMTEEEADGLQHLIVHALIGSSHVSQNVQRAVVLGFAEVLDTLISETKDSASPRDRRIADAATVVRGLFPSVPKPNDDEREPPERELPGDDASEVQ